MKSKNRVNCIDCFDLDNDGVGIPGGFGFFVEMMMSQSAFVFKKNKVQNGLFGIVVVCCLLPAFWLIFVVSMCKVVTWVKVTGCMVFVCQIAVNVWDLGCFTHVIKYTLED